MVTRMYQNKFTLIHILDHNANAPIYFLMQHMEYFYMFKMKEESLSLLSYLHFPLHPPLSSLCPPLLAQCCYTYTHRGALQTVRENNQGRGENGMASVTSGHPWPFLFTAQRGHSWATTTKKHHIGPCVGNFSWRWIIFSMIQGIHCHDTNTWFSLENIKLLEEGLEMRTL